MKALEKLHKMIDDPNSWHFLRDMIASVPLAQKDPRYAVAAGVADLLLKAIEEHKKKDQIKEDVKEEKENG